MTDFTPFDPVGLRQRRDQYFSFARQQASQVFRPDGTYQPTTENDPRIPYWLYPSLITAADPGTRELANASYAAAPGWDEFNVFLTSAIAVNLVRERAHMRPDLIARSEEHLARFAMIADMRQPSSGCNDYAFHGYNDNMPAMSVRALILTGDMLGRPDCTDRGLFNLEGLCAHLERRGLLTEYTSGTYTPITVTALMDVAECSTHAEAREMALACVHRVLLDLFAHWHRGTGTIGGAQSRGYQVDATETASTWNAWLWYLTGDRLCLNPIEALSDPAYRAPLHHDRNRAFNLASWAEMFAPSYTLLAPAVRDFARAPRDYPGEIHATTDAGTGSGAIRTRAFHQPQYFLGTASHTWFDHSGQQLTLHGAAATVPQPQTWRDRVAFWHRTQLAADEGADYIVDFGKYHTLQKRGSALVLGALGANLLSKEVRDLSFNIIFGTFHRLPDEIVEAGPWHGLRFGEVYVGVRLAGMVAEQRCAARQVLSNGYLRLELPLLTQPVILTPEVREWCDFGYVLEIAARDECGSFAEFCRQCQATTWEFYHGAYRSSRYVGRHGELQIVDEVATYHTRFMAIDGEVEPAIKFAATGLDPALTKLFPDGRRVTQRRILYDARFAGSPFYPGRTHVIESDRQPGAMATPQAAVAGGEPGGSR